MGWAAGFFGEGGVVLVVGCLVGMGLLMWLLFRLTGDSAARVSVQPPRQGLDQMLSDELIPPTPGHGSGQVSKGQVPDASGSVAP